MRPGLASEHLSPTIAELWQLLGSEGRRAYVGEPVTITEHQLQAAGAAELAGCTTAMIMACLLHDIGWLLRDGPRGHDRRGAAHLASCGFGPAVTEPVRLHVTAKRHLCATEPSYAATLSLASQRTLELQGGPLDAEASAEFLAQPFSADALSLRRCDDQAKVAHRSTPGLDHFLPALEDALANP